MNQVTFDFATLPVAPADRVGFELGWDHARHALVPPAELLQGGTSVGQGWHAARAVFGQRVLVATRLVRCWLALRLEAWQGGCSFELTQVTPNYLGQIETAVCPVTRRPLGGAPEGADAPLIVRLRLDAGYAAGNLVMMSRRAAQARGALDPAQVLQRARRSDDDAATEGLDHAAWWRLAVLLSFTTPLSQAEATRLPLRLLPPNRVRLLNPAQGLQALLTLQLAQPGWARQARRIADLLPLQALRHDFNLFIGALAPRLIEALNRSPGRDQREALEDAWADTRVQRRWQHFAGQLGEGAAEQMTERLAAGGLAGRHTLVHAAAAATEGWSLPTQGRLPAPRRSEAAVTAGHGAVFAARHTMVRRRLSPAA